MISVLGLVYEEYDILLDSTNCQFVKVRFGNDIVSGAI